MKNCKNLTILMALVSITSVASAGFWPTRGLFDNGTNLAQNVQSSVWNVCDGTVYNIRSVFGLVSPVEQAQRELTNLGKEIKNDLIEAGVSATADICESFLPESLRNKINMKNLVKVGGVLVVLALFTASDRISSAKDFMCSSEGGLAFADCAGNLLQKADGLNLRMQRCLWPTKVCRSRVSDGIDIY